MSELVSVLFNGRRCYSFKLEDVTQIPKKQDLESQMPIAEATTEESRQPEDQTKLDNQFQKERE